MADSKLLYRYKKQFYIIENNDSYIFNKDPQVTCTSQNIWTHFFAFNFFHFEMGCKSRDLNHWRIVQKQEELLMFHSNPSLQISHWKFKREKNWLIYESINIAFNAIFRKILIQMNCFIRRNLAL